MRDLKLESSLFVDNLFFVGAWLRWAALSSWFGLVWVSLCRRTRMRVLSCRGPYAFEKVNNGGADGTAQVSD